MFSFQLLKGFDCLHPGLNWLGWYGFNSINGIHWILRVFGLSATRFHHTGIIGGESSSAKVSSPHHQKSICHHQHQRIADWIKSFRRQELKDCDGPKTIPKHCMLQSYSGLTCQVLPHIISCIWMCSAQLTVYTC